LVRTRTGGRRARTCSSDCQDGPQKVSFSVRAVEKWNKLPEEVRAPPSRLSEIDEESL
jgi:hypothetical protein